MHSFQIFVLRKRVKVMRYNIVADYAIVMCIAYNLEETIGGYIL